MGLIPKFIKKLQPFKILGKVVSAVVPGGSVAVGAVETVLGAVKGTKVSGPQIVAAAAEGAKQNLAEQLGGNAASDIVKKYAVPGGFIAAGLVIVYLIGRGRKG